MSTWSGAASMPLRSAAGVFSAADNRLKEIDTLVGEIQMDFRSLHTPNCVFNGEEIEDDDDVVDPEYLEIMTLAGQIRCGVRELQTALDRKRIYDSSYGDEDRSMEETQGQACWFPSASQLELIIHSLDAQLRHCLLCLAMFPADELIKKKMLIHYWIGEGIVQSVTAGKDCFTDLLSRGLIQPACQRQHCSKVHYCKIPPIVSNFLVKTAHRMGFYQFDGEGKPMEDFDSERSRRACLWERQIGGRGDDVNELYGPSSCKDLLTLYNFNRQYVNMDKTWLSKQAEMSTLQLGQWKPSWRHRIEIVSPETLEAATMCESLKYLSLRGISLIEYIPDSIGNLQNLVVMDLSACHNLEKLSDSIGSLRKLQFLDVSECYLLDEMPEGIGSLEELQVLKGFLVGGATSKSNPCRLADLASLPKLRKLSISTGRRALVVQEDELNKLQGCTALESLTITWGAAAAAQGPKRQLISGVEGSIKGTSMGSELLLPPRLEKLDLRRTPMENLMHLLHPGNAENLKRLYIRGGKLKSFGDVEGWNVETLRVRFLKVLECDWERLRASFGKLRFLEMRECPNLTSWECDGEGVWREDDDNGTTHVGCFDK
ncbi:hypothetical protein EE612_008028 [Oryza sativa]|nr:hypothetical protein EE612_008028 [Oryza sativa]